jgi:hypothetical protein
MFASLIQFKSFILKQSLWDIYIEMLIRSFRCLSAARGSFNKPFLKEIRFIDIFDSLLLNDAEIGLHMSFIFSSFK